jgi:hypothetical protein
MIPIVLIILVIIYLYYDTKVDMGDRLELIDYAIILGALCLGLGIILGSLLVNIIP